MICCVVASSALSGCGNLSPDELNRGAGSLDALAAQGQLIASGVAENRTKTTYVRVMSRTLSEEAQHEAEKLADATPAEGSERARDRTVRLAEAIRDLYSELQTYPGDEARGRRIEAAFRSAQNRLETIEDRLDSA